MTANSHDPARRQAAIEIWENEGGSPGHDQIDYSYGRRIELDRSWTVYHVFTGVPVGVGNNKLSGLSRVAATEKMLSLNRRSETGRGERTM